ncbi:MAG: sacsin N-terminal ATP-binding-like domain-containing protein, partial [Bacteroidales bacterium]
MAPILFIENLSKAKSNYSNPEQAIDQANSCDSLSNDIYTDNKRFIYELLQNADDASCNNGKLDFQINFVDNYIIISHNGELFSEIDIKSICSVGDGNKRGDENKTGYKGIGFKSVFANSDFVIIKSGEYCFKFDKNESNKWNSNWDINENDWKEVRKNEGKEDEIRMPWQIIPIWTDIPENLNQLSVFNEYNVSTIIRLYNIDELKNSLIDLFSNSQIILFLRSKEIKITINTSKTIILEKTINNDIAAIKQDNHISSEWLIKNNEFDIPEDIQSKIKNDNRYPRKLRESKKTDITFAIQLENNKLKPVDEDKQLIFTYLPTSINYGFPFLVNANFLTDAGRENIHKDYKWNQWLFEQISIKYFEWISDLANLNSKFNRQFITVLPQKLNGFNSLESKFNEGYKTAIESIAFIPNQQGKLIKVADAIYDETNISEFINKQTLINYINSDLDSQYTISSFIPHLKPINVLKHLGVKIFRIEELDGFFKSDIFSSEHIVAENFKLISFLFNQANNSQKGENADDWNYRLKNTPFIFDKNKDLQTPEHIYFPSIEFSEDFKDDISIINNDVLKEINKNQPIKDWLVNLGVKKPTDVSFIEKTIIGDSDYINEENAIKIGRYLFHAKIDGILSDQHFSNLQHVKFLTQKGTLKKAQDCFLSDFYEPELKLEEVLDVDFYVSEKYFESSDSKRDWKTFFLKIGILESVKLKTIKIKSSDAKIKYKCFESFFNKNSTQVYHAWSGNKWNNKIVEYELKLYTLIEYTDNYNFSKVFWNKVFEIPFERKSKDKGDVEFNEDYNKKLQDKNTLDENLFEWTIKNLEVFPITTNKCKKASEVFNNNISQIKEIAGKYLPILDYDGIVSPEWQEILNFKDQIKLDDYLTILTEIWKDTGLSDEEKKENKERVLLVYEKLSELFSNLHDDEKNRLKAWSENNKLLAKDGEFYPPKELSYVTIEGFNANKLIYSENNIDDKTINLFGYCGIKVINKVIPKFSNSIIRQESLRKQLEYIAPLIALISVKKSNNKKEWENEYKRICDVLSDITFFETTEIILTYGNNDDKQQRSTYSEENKFYYIGDWKDLTVLDGLIEPLCKLLNIKSKERLLLILLSTSYDKGLKHLIEKGYDKSIIPKITNEGLNINNIVNAFEKES